jgi:hypothetical protein
MANTINIPRAHLIMALCLPLAVLLGYFLAEPMDSASVTVVVFLLVILAVPLMMKWHHPLLVLSWNAWITPQFLPGQPFLWMLIAPISLLFSVTNRAINPDSRFTSVPSLTRSLCFFVGVVFVTALMTGGIGLHSLGGARYGGRGYFYIFAAVIGYFALSSQPIPAGRAGLYLAMFFLPGMTSLISNLAYSAGPGFYFLYSLFPSSFALEQATGDNILRLGSIVRIGGLAPASISLFAFLLIRYGIRGIFDLSRPWRGFFFLLSVLGCLAGGFRTNLILFGLAFIALFYVEGLHRTRLLALCAGLGLVGAAILLPFADKLPLSVQRTLSFLPVNVDPMVRQAADESSQWRLEIWRMVLPDVPKYLLKGKGYSVDPHALEGSVDPTVRVFDQTYTPILTGEYHNGPLSIIIPFGIFGLIGFVWFVTAALRVLYHHYQFGDPRLKRANSFLFAFFLAKTLIFFLIFGSLWVDIFSFTGIIGLSVALNSQPETVLVEEPVEESLETLETFT